MAEDEDPYVYPGTLTLKNRFGTRDAAVLREVEYVTTTKRAADALSFPSTVEGYLALHRHLFGEVYDWAGELRTVNISKGGTGFAPVRFLDNSLDTVFRDLAARGHLRALPAERFAEQAAHHVSELNAVHPFRVMLN